jgi:hypothetical protein
MDGLAKQETFTDVPKKRAVIEMGFRNRRLALLARRSKLSTAAAISCRVDVVVQV